MPTKTTKSTKSTKSTSSPSSTKPTGNADLYKPLAGVAISQEQYEQEDEQASGQLRVEKLATKRAGILEQRQKTNEGEAKVAMATDKAANAWQRRETEGQTLALKLQQSQRTLTHTQRETELHSELLDIKQQGMEKGVAHARTLFDIQSETFTAEVSMAKSRLAGRAAEAKQLAATIDV